MSVKAIVNYSDFKDFCDTVRAKTQKTETIRSQDMATETEAVYSAGKEKIYSDFYGFFWDLYQNNGQKTDYSFAFTDPCWSDESFRPKYDIVLGATRYSATQTFHNSKIQDIKGCLERAGVTMDFSLAQRMSGTFHSSLISSLPPINVAGCTELQLTFYNMKNLNSLTIENLRADCTFDRTFNASKFKHLSITGVIGNNGIDLADADLDRDSLLNIISCLQDKSGTGTAFSVTLGSRNLNKLTATEKAAASSKGWTLL